MHLQYSDKASLEQRCPSMMQNQRMRKLPNPHKSSHFEIKNTIKVFALEWRHFLKALGFSPKLRRPCQVQLGSLWPSPNHQNVLNVSLRQLWSIVSKSPVSHLALPTTNEGTPLEPFRLQVILPKISNRIMPSSPAYISPTPLVGMGLKRAWDY